MANRFVLLDRDGVINEAVRGDYVRRASQLRLLPGAAEAVAEFNRQGFRVLVVSNQQGIGKGFFTQSNLDDITVSLRELIADESGGVIGGFYYCPHLAAEACVCRKPKPGLILRAQEEHRFDLGSTYFVGDTYNDLATAVAAGCRPLFVLSGLDGDQYRAGDLPADEAEFVAEDLAGAARYVIGQQ